MPKQIIDTQDVLDAALQLVKISGYDSINARAVAKYMSCSVQPIYSYFENMEDLKKAVYQKAFEFYNGYILERTDEEDCILSMAKANVSFAKNQANVFRLLFLTKLEGNNSFTDIFDWIGRADAADALAKKLKVSTEKAKDIYIMMMIFTHGIATMLATESADIAEKEILLWLTKAQTAFTLL